MMATKPASRSSSRTRAENIHSYAYKGQEYAYMQATGRRSRNSSPTRPLARSATTSANGNNYGMHGGNYRGVPPEPEIDYVDPFGKEAKKDKKSVVNGVKVMFNLHKNKDAKKAEEVTFKINSPYSHFQPRPRSISPTKVSETGLANGYPSRKAEKDSPVPNGNEIVLRNTLEDDVSLEDDASVKIVPVEIWDSGQVLVANTNNREQSCTEIPGEGKLMKTSEERSQVWRHKTRRKYYETVKKDKPPRDGSVNGSQTSHMSRKSNSKPKQIEYTSAKTDDDKLYSANELDEAFLDKQNAMEHEREIAKHVRWTEHAANSNHSNHGHANNNHNNARKEAQEERSFFPYLDSYLPRMEDKSTQCNIPKPHKSKRFEISQDFRVIKSKEDGSVSTFSDVPIMSPDKYDKPPPLVKPNGTGRPDGVIYSQIDRNRKVTPQTNTVTRLVAREVELTPEPTTEFVYEANPTRSYNSRTHSRSPSPLITRRKESPSPLLRRRQDASPGSRSRTTTKAYSFHMGSGLGPDMSKRGASLQPPKEWYTVPTTMADEHARERQKRAYERSLARETIEETISISNASSDDMSAHNGHEVDERKKMTSVVREIDPEKKTMTYENPNSRGRTNTQSSPYENNTAGIWFKALDEDYRRGMARSEVSFPAAGLTSDDPLPTSSYATMTRANKRAPDRQVHRLDYERASPVQHAYTLDRRYLEERKRNKASSLKQGPVMGRREMLDNGFGQSASDRCGPTTNTMRRYASQRSVMTTDGNGELRRGGLAAAYKNRQKRASSLNRAGDRISLSGSQYRLAQESDPVVMYIPG